MCVYIAASVGGDQLLPHADRFIDVTVTIILHAVIMMLWSVLVMGAVALTCRAAVCEVRETVPNK